MAENKPLLEIGGIGAIILTYLSIASTGLLEPLDAIMIFDYTLLQFILFTLIFFGIGVIIMNIVVALIMKTSGASLSDIKQAVHQAEGEVTEFIESVSGLSKKEAKRVTDNMKAQYSTAAKASASKIVGKSKMKAKAKAKVNVVIREGIPTPEELRAKFRAAIPTATIMAISEAYPEEHLLVEDDLHEIILPSVRMATSTGLLSKGKSMMRQIVKYIGMVALSALILAIAEYFIQ